MAEQQVFTSKRNGSLWIQPNGPNTKPQYLPCYDLEDITESFGGTTPIYCIDARGQYVQIASTDEAPEPVTTTLGTYVGKTADAIELVRCPFGLYVHLRDCGRADTFENYARTAIVQVQKVTNRTRSGLVRKEEDMVAMHTFDIEALSNVIDVFRLVPLNESVEATGDINDILFLDDPSCWDNCGQSQGSCDLGYAVTSAESGSPSDTGKVLVRNLTTGGWNATAADPFGAAEDIASLAVFKVGKNVTRILVARGTTDAGNPAEVAYSDDDGATWTNVDVGATNGQYAIDGESMFAFNRYGIWLVTTGGYIYKSEDGGESWTEQEGGTITTNAYNSVLFANENVGFAFGAGGEVVKTTNGGITWGSVTSPAALSITGADVLSPDRLWVGNTQGGLYYSNDGGSTWNSRSFGGTSGAATDIHDIDFANDYVGFLVQDSGGAGILYFTINGGFSWEQQTSLPSNTGLNAIYACDSNNVYIGANAGQLIALSIA